VTDLDIRYAGRYTGILLDVGGWVVMWVVVFWVYLGLMRMGVPLFDYLRSSAKLPILSSFDYVVFSRSQNSLIKGPDIFFSPVRCDIDGVIISQEYLL
jgi:hypothetical protein